MLNKKHIKNIKTHILFFPHKFFVDKTPLFCLIITVPGDCPDLFPDAGGPVVGEDLLGLEGQPAGGAGVARGEGVAALQVVAHVVPVPRHVLAHTAHTTTHVQDFLCFCIFRSFVCLFVCLLSLRAVWAVPSRRKVERFQRGVMGLNFILTMLRHILT